MTTTETGGTRGYDADGRMAGRKRHAMLDTDRGALENLAHAADLQDRGGAVLLLKRAGTIRS